MRMKAAIYRASRPFRWAVDFLSLLLQAFHIKMPLKTPQNKAN
jgi:hypothetical protein